MKKRNSIIICAVVLVLMAVFLNRAAIFQRGNPIPYLAAAMRLSEEVPFVAVDEAQGIYITQRGDCAELFDYIQQKMGGTLVEQAGSGYIFSDGNANYVVSSEVYWGRYTVWTLP